MTIQNTQKVDTLQKYGMDFQIKVISSLLSDKTFIERMNDIINPYNFESEAHQWLIKEIMDYFIEYKNLPTLTTFKVKIDSIESAVLKQSVIDQLRLVYQKVSDTDIQFVKEEFLEFCKNQTLKKAIMNSVDYLQDGNYDGIKGLIDNALKAGMERNLGHDYIIDIDKRMSSMSRNCIKTNWQEVDTILDGGLAPGELGVVTSPAGIGKCVGPNTEIDIQYMETGIPIKGNSGKEYILWFKPYDKFEFDGRLLYGWQIDNILFELEKVKQRVLESENIQKK